MQKIKRKSHKKSIVLLSSFALLVIAGAIILWFFMTHHATAPKKPTKNAPINGVNYNPPTPAEQQQGDKNKQNIVNNQSNSSSSGSSTPSSAITVSVSRASQLSAGQPLQIRTTISGTSSGNCVITFSQSGQQSFTKTFPIVFDATYATCSNANVDASNFATSGAWSMQVVAQSAAGNSAPTTQNVTITK